MYLCQIITEQWLVNGASDLTISVMPLQRNSLVSGKICLGDKSSRKDLKRSNKSRTKARFVSRNGVPVTSGAVVCLLETVMFFASQLKMLLLDRMLSCCFKQFHRGTQKEHLLYSFQKEQLQLWLLSPEDPSVPELQFK